MSRQLMMLTSKMKNPKLKAPLEKKNPILAALLSLFTGGLGQVYLGQPQKGVCLIALFLIGLPLAGLGFVVLPLAALDAYNSAKRLERGEALDDWHIFGERGIKIEVKRAPSKWQVLDVAMTGKREEFIGQEFKNIDNSMSDVTLTREFDVTREWSKSYQIEHERTIIRKLGIGVDLVTIIVPLDIEAAVSQSVKQKFSITETTKFSFRERVSLRVPARKNVRVTIFWKNIWQVWSAKLRDQYGTEIEVPFQIIEGVSFDQAQSN